MNDKLKKEVLRAGAVVILDELEFFVCHGDVEKQEAFCSAYNDIVEILKEVGFSNNEVIESMKKYRGLLDCAKL